MRVMNAAVLTLFTVSVFGVVMAGGASAFHPLFLTKSGKTLSFTGTSQLSVLRGLNVGILGSIDCEKGASSGEFLNKSTLARKIELEYSGKCEQLVNTTKTACTEPVKFKLTFGELGLTGSKKIALLLAPESGTEFGKVTCGSNTTTIEGSLVGEFPEINAAGERQYATWMSSLELAFKSENKSEIQTNREISLLGTNMTGVELNFSGFFGGKASLESTQTMSADAGVSICTE